MELSSNGVQGYVEGLRDAGYGNAATSGDFMTMGSTASMGHAMAYADQLDRMHRRREAEDLEHMTKYADTKRAFGLGEVAHYQGLEAARAYNADTPYYEDERRWEYEKRQRARENDQMILEVARMQHKDLIRSRQERDDYMASKLFLAFEDIYDGKDNHVSKESLDVINEALGKDIADIRLNERGQLRAFNSKGEDMQLTNDFFRTLTRYAHVKDGLGESGIAGLVMQSLPKAYQESLQQDIALQRMDYEYGVQAQKLQASKDEKARESAMDLLKYANTYREYALNLEKSIKEGEADESQLAEVERLRALAKSYEENGNKLLNISGGGHAPSTRDQQLQNIGAGISDDTSNIPVATF